MRIRSAASSTAQPHRTQAARLDPKKPSRTESAGGAPSQPKTAGVRLPAIDGAAQARAHDLRRLSFEGAPYDVLLPGGGAADAWATYVQRLTASGAFAHQGAALRELAALKPLPGPALDEATPRVGVSISEADMLRPGSNENLVEIIDGIVARGCRPVLIPPCADLMLPEQPKARRAGIAAMAAQLDGLVGPGGADVAPSIYGKEITHAVDTNYRRDVFERDLFQAALHQPLFMFAICRSHQLLMGELWQDVMLEGLVSHSHVQTAHGISKRQVMDQGSLEHRVYFKAGSRMAQILAHRQSALTNTFHHQAAKAAPPGFKVVGVLYDPENGHEVIEAAERWNALTTQFHPEVMEEAWAQALFGTVCRRAQVFRELKLMARQGPVTVAELARRIDARWPALLHEADRAWIREDLGPRLRWLGR